MLAAVAGVVVRFGRVLPDVANDDSDETMFGVEFVQPTNIIH